MTPSSVSKGIPLVSSSPLMSVGVQVTPELLASLKDLFPDRCPTLGTPLESVWFEAGQANVVAFLQMAFEEATKNILTSTE